MMHKDFVIKNTDFHHVWFIECYEA